MTGIVGPHGTWQGKHPNLAASPKGEDKQTAPVQVRWPPGMVKPARPPRIPWWLHMLAYRRYAQRYGTGQSAERLAECAGFEAWEALSLIAELSPAEVAEHCAAASFPTVGQAPVTGRDLAEWEYHAGMAARSANAVWERIRRACGPLDQSEREPAAAQAPVEDTTQRHGYPGERDDRSLSSMGTCKADRPFRNALIRALDEIDRLRKRCVMIEAGRRVDFEGYVGDLSRLRAQLEAART